MSCTYLIDQCNLLPWLDYQPGEAGNFSDMKGPQKPQVHCVLVYGDLIADLFGNIHHQSTMNGNGNGLEVVPEFLS